MGSVLRLNCNAPLGARLRVARFAGSVLPAAKVSCHGVNTGGSFLPKPCGGIATDWSCGGVSNLLMPVLTDETRMGDTPARQTLHSFAYHTTKH